MYFLLDFYIIKFNESLNTFLLISIVVIDSVPCFSFCNSSLSSAMILLRWKIEKNYWRRKNFLHVSFAVLH